MRDPILLSLRILGIETQSDPILILILIPLRMSRTEKQSDTTSLILRNWLAKQRAGLFGPTTTHEQKRAERIREGLARLAFTEIHRAHEAAAVVVDFLLQLENCVE